MATLQNIGKLKYRGKDGQWHPLPVVVQDTGGGVSTISGKGAPTSETQGKVNQLYRDEDTQRLYICTETDGGYTWAAVSGGSVDVDATLTKAGQAADAKAAGDAIRNKLDKTELPTAINDALAQAKASGEFDGAKGDKGEKGDKGDPGDTGPAGQKGETGPAGADGNDGAQGPAGKDGKSAYQYAQDGGYTGTEAEFAAKLAQEKFANPNALTFTGAVTGSYDGSAPLSVAIPSGGGGSGASESWKLIRTINIVSGTSSYSFDTDNNGNAFKVKNFLILIDAYPSGNGYLEIKPNGNFSFYQHILGKKNYPFSFMMKRVTDGRYILENSNSIFERKISAEYASFGEFTSFAFWFSGTPDSDTTMYILGEDVL